ncbi:hypothetical protein [Paraglaciecola sp.]|uniref:hypothetical protein n=1 Tax=Paraglaciecola sp. TaxID=1920173 RepID=UPI00273F86B9|nr:hypothetical protein [Paraglaciecola sp.]MDP5031854.1 hypothetical protein [Paraglaciecola sp.]
MIKRVVVHVGPPKTGTSAIQKWFSKNRDLLLENGVLYPQHQLDPNGVSSGNLHNVCDISVEGSEKTPPKVLISKTKITHLLECFNRSDAHTLFLSSEYFFQHLEALSLLIPNVEFLAYLRNPIEILESNYNQGVKRNGFIHSLDSKTFDCFPHVSHLTRFKKAFPASTLTVRYFDLRLNGSSSLVADVLTVLGLDVKADLGDALESVNASYNFEALELKRWLNKFSIKEYQIEIDYILQSYVNGTAKFSLLPPDEYTKIARNYAEMAIPICADLGLKDGVMFSDAILNQQQDLYCEQVLSKKQFSSVVHYLRRKMNIKFYPFFKSLLTEERHKSDLYLDWFLAFKPNPVYRLIMLLKIKMSYLSNSSSMLRGRVLLKLSSNNLKGLKEFRTALDVPQHTQDADIYRELGFLAERNGEYKIAISMLEKASILRPNGKLIHSRLRKLKSLYVNDVSASKKKQNK